MTKITEQNQQEITDAVITDDFDNSAVTVMIKATSRVSAKLGDNYYTFEFTEERFIPEEDSTDIEFEREHLWDTVHEQVDLQLQEIRDIYNN